MQPISQQVYAQRVKAASPASPVVKDCALAFFSGGLVCTLGEFLCQSYQAMGLSLQDARASVSLSLIALSAFLTALGLYEKIAKHTGAGTLVPITGFANSVVSPAMEFRSEGVITGLGAKMFIVSGPVLVFGVAASAVYGAVLLLFHLV